MPLVRSVTWAAMLAAVSLSNARIDTPTLASEGSLGGCAASRACGSGFWLGGRVLALRGGGKGRGATGGGGRWATNVIKLEPEESSEEKGLEGMETLTNAGIGTLEFGNILVDGRTVGMMYENCKDGDTAMLMSKDPVPTYDRRLGGKGDVYFEPGRKGKWKAVPVPEGMTKQQLYT
ncbi:hypothetical protein T484DRAFT_1814558 [Baffinella frigidus]|nr:hypothetical protein T484DRAFT_1814558 [Cryptophyta sp. CCMP2293]